MFRKLVFLVIPSLILEIGTVAGQNQSNVLLKARIENNKKYMIKILYQLQQTDYDIKFERVELIRYNENFAQTATATTFKYNRTCAAVNASLVLKMDIVHDVEVVCQAYKFMSNEYRQFPMRVQANFCDAFQKNAFGAVNSLKCGNFRGCPMLKGKKYEVCNWTIDQSKFPPLIPNGQYMVEFQGFVGGVDAGLVRAYGSVSRRIPY